MAKGDAATVAEGYRLALRDMLVHIDGVSLLHLRGELQVVVRWLESRKEPVQVKLAEKALDAVSEFYAFGVEIGGFEQSSKTASQVGLFDSV
jgi:hypothetical protein